MYLCCVESLSQFRSNLDFLRIFKVTIIIIIIIFSGKGDDYSGSRKGDKTTGGRRDSTPDVSRIQALGNKKEKVNPIYPTKHVLLVFLVFV